MRGLNPGSLHKVEGGMAPATSSHFYAVPVTSSLYGEARTSSFFDSQHQKQVRVHPRLVASHSLVLSHFLTRLRRLRRDSDAIQAPAWWASQVRVLWKKDTSKRSLASSAKWLLSGPNTPYQLPSFRSVSRPDTFFPFSLSGIYWMIIYGVCNIQAEGLTHASTAPVPAELTTSTSYQQHQHSSSSQSSGPLHLCPRSLHSQSYAQHARP